MRTFDRNCQRIHELNLAAKEGATIDMTDLPTCSSLSSSVKNQIEVNTITNQQQMSGPSEDAHCNGSVPDVPNTIDTDESIDATNTKCFFNDHEGDENVDDNFSNIFSDQLLDATATSVNTNALYLYCSMGDLENGEDGETLYLHNGSLNHSLRSGTLHRISSSDKENISQPLTSGRLLKPKYSFGKW